MRSSASATRSNSSATTSRMTSLTRSMRGYRFVLMTRCSLFVQIHPAATGFDHLDLGERPHEPLHLVEDVLDVGGAAAHGRHAQPGALPEILLAHLRNGHAIA